MWLLVPKCVSDREREDDYSSSSSSSSSDTDDDSSSLESPTDSEDSDKEEEEDGKVKDSQISGCETAYSYFAYSLFCDLCAYQYVDIAEPARLT